MRKKIQIIIIFLVGLKKIIEMRSIFFLPIWLYIQYDTKDTMAYCYCNYNVYTYKYAFVALAGSWFQDMNHPAFKFKLTSFISTNIYLIVAFRYQNSFIDVDYRIIIYVTKDMVVFVYHKIQRTRIIIKYFNQVTRMY